MAEADNLAPVLMLIIGAAALDITPIDESADRHEFLLYYSLSLLPAISQRAELRLGPCNARCKKIRIGSERQLLAAGSLATKRSDTANSSSWKCGRKKATAL